MLLEAGPANELMCLRNAADLTFYRGRSVLDIDLISYGSRYVLEDGGARMPET